MVWKKVLVLSWTKFVATKATVWCPRDPQAWVVGRRERRERDTLMTGVRCIVR
jgi:hypothetical protein